MISMYRLLICDGRLQLLASFAPCKQEMEKCNDCAFELCALSGVHGGGAESFPYNALADVGGNEE